MKKSLDTINKKFENLESVVEGLFAKLSKHDEDKKLVDDGSFASRLYELEKQCHANEQYSRRDSLEIVGIKENVTNNNLEKNLCGVLADIGVNVNERDIQACHRLGDGKRTIVKFTNGKIVFEVLSNRKKLALMGDYRKNIYINEIFAHVIVFFHGKCKGLWKQNKISGY